MELTYIKLICVVIVILTTVIAGLYPFLKRIKTSAGKEFPIGEALASGVFLGAGLLHMLGDAAEGFSSLGHEFPWAFLLAGLIFLLLVWLEHIGREIYQTHYHASFAIIATVMLSLHSFLAGAALGLSSDLALLTVILIAILAHKWAASFALAIQINKSNLPLGSSILLFSLFAIMAPLGIIFGSIVTHGLNYYPLLEPIFTSLAAGTFIYLGTLHGLSQSMMVKQCCNLKEFSFVVLGFILMAIVAIWT